MDPTIGMFLRTRWLYIFLFVGFLLIAYLEATSVAPSLLFLACSSFLAGWAIVAGYQGFVVKCYQQWLSVLTKEIDAIVKKAKGETSKTV